MAIGLPSPSSFSSMSHVTPSASLVNTTVVVVAGIGETGCRVQGLHSRGKCAFRLPYGKPEGKLWGLETRVLHDAEKRLTSVFAKIDHWMPIGHYSRRWHEESGGYVFHVYNVTMDKIDVALSAKDARRKLVELV